MVADSSLGFPADDEAAEYYLYCEDLFKIYKVADLEVVALRGLDLRVRRGELMGIVGASGSGKSTLLNILAGLDVPSAGRAFVGGRNLLAMTAEDLVVYRRKEVGFIWQQTGRNLLPYLTALENVEVPLLLAGTGGGKARALATDLLNAVGLGHRLKHRPERLSGGEQQRVSIAVALANQPPLLLADEPTGELDSIGADSVFTTLRELNQRLGVTILIVTHDPAIADRVERVVTIRDGRLSTETFRHVEVTHGSAQVSYDDYAVVDGTGRLQIPRALLDRLAIGERARIELDGDRLVILPEPKREQR